MLRFIIAIAAAIALPCSAAFAAPLEAYGRLPQIENVAISSDGKLVALALTDGEQRSVAIHDVATDQRIAAIRAGDTKVRDLRWAGPEHLLITISVTGRLGDEFVGVARGERFTTILYDVPEKRQKQVLSKMDYATLNVTGSYPMVRTIEGQPTVFLEGVAFVNYQGRRAMFQTPAGGLKSKIAEVGSRYTDDFLLDPAGEVVARSEYDDESGAWTIGVKRDGRWVDIAKGSHRFTSPGLVAVGSTPDTLLVNIDTEDGYVLHDLNVKDGSLSVSPLHKPGQALLYNTLGQVIGTSVREGETRTHVFFDKRDQAIWAGIIKAYPGDRVALESWSDDHQKIVVYVDSPEAGPAYALVDLSAKKAKWLGDVYRGIGPKDISPVKPIAYKAADGLNIPGYLTVPNSKEAKNLPLVVLPHGGPASRDSLGFDWWAQALASQGYAVLQPNFRGSDGLGVNFLEAGYGEFGRKMQTDLSDGVRHLAAEGIIDPKRVCIAGGSYGGYAALAGATLDRGVYRCAASIAGPSDLALMLKTEQRESGDATLRYWANFMGVEGVKDPDLNDISPIRHIGKIEIPVLLIHGKDDTVVPYDQSRLMAEAMTAAGKPAQFVTLEGEDHWLSRGATRQKMLVELVAFLKAHNPPD